MKSRVYFWSFVTLTAAYAVLSLTLPTDPKVLEKYQLTQTQSHIVSLAIVIPIVVIYAAALYGSVRVTRYASSISTTTEAVPFNLIARGLAVLAIGLPFISIISSILTYLAFQNKDLLPMITIVRNYISLLFPAAAFIYLEKGATGLIGTLRNKKIALPLLFSSLGIIIASSLFTWLVIARSNGVPEAQSIYFLPDWLVVTTLIIPYLYIWYKGSLAAFYLFKYQQHVKGSIYKAAIRYLAWGIGTIVFSSVFIQVLSTASERLNRLNLTPILLLIYFLLILYAVGYGLVAHGAKQLRKIEEV